MEYTYLWLPSKCLHCDKWGHSSKTCPSNKGEQESQKVQLDLEGEKVEVSERVEGNAIIVGAQSLEVEEVTEK